LGMEIYMPPHARHCIAHLQASLPALASETYVYLLSYVLLHYYAHRDALKFQCAIFKA
jgi:hypothetical protein